MNNITSKKVLGITVVATVIIGIGAMFFQSNQEIENMIDEHISSEETAVYDKEETPINATYEAITETTTQLTGIKVYISGAVVEPGVYTVSEDFRVIDVVERAKGFTENADKESINLADFISDGQHIIVPEIYDENESVNKTGSSSGNSQGKNGRKININTATKEDLMQLDGIGESKAERIIEYRENKRFKKIEEIVNVRGIGTAIFESIRNDITV